MTPRLSGFDSPVLLDDGMVSLLCSECTDIYNFFLIGYTWPRDSKIYCLLKMYVVFIDSQCVS